MDLIGYQDLIKDAMLSVVKNVLKKVEKEGLPENHHFMISFATNHSGTVVPKYLLQTYPEEMTIVLQYQFDNLTVRQNSFSVDLAFGGVMSTITIPFGAIKLFRDPYTGFQVSFQITDTIDQKNVEESELDSGEDSLIRNNDTSEDKVVKLDFSKKK